jgi:hypothetical protein
MLFANPTNNHLIPAFAVYILQAIQETIRRLENGKWTRLLFSLSVWVGGCVCVWGFSFCRFRPVFLSLFILFYLFFSQPKDSAP